MFQGAIALNLDAKGRLAIPSRCRDALAKPAEGRLVVTTHPHRCLSIYPETEWTPIAEQIMAVPGLDPRSAAIKRLLVGNAREEQMDAAGRVLIAPELRAWAGLDKQVWLVGQGRCFELWSDERWQQQQEELLAQLASSGLPAGFENLAL
jgi:MraZ protein